jgi:L-asparaginase II
MSNPVLVEVTRGNMIESRHRGRVAVVDPSGTVVFSQGDIDSPVFPRSSCKAMQALPLVESGAADAYGFGNRELAISCASHSGEEAHADLVLSMLKAAGRDEDTLECGAHWSFYQQQAIEQARAMDRPGQRHNNCSGKHAGFICACCHSGEDPAGYVDYDHPLQREIRGAMESLTGAALGHDNCGTDGCSIPTYATPLKGLAHGFAKMVSGHGLGPVRASASKRLMQACMAEPFYVAGTKRACTVLMEAAPGRIFAKLGAEGVYVAALPEHDLAIAVKCDDGTERAAVSMVSGVIARFFAGEPELQARITAIGNYDLKNWAGTKVGEIRLGGALA